MSAAKGSRAVLGDKGGCRGRERAYIQNDCVYCTVRTYMRDTHAPTLRRRSGSRPPGQQPPPPSMLPATPVYYYSA